MDVFTDAGQGRQHQQPHVWPRERLAGMVKSRRSIPRSEHVGNCREAGSGMSPVGGNRLSLERESRKHWAEEPGKPRIPPGPRGRSSAHPPASGRVRPEGQGGEAPEPAPVGGRLVRSESLTGWGSSWGWGLGADRQTDSSVSQGGRRKLAVRTGAGTGTGGSLVRVGTWKR